MALPDNEHNRAGFSMEDFILPPYYEKQAALTTKGLPSGEPVLGTAPPYGTRAPDLQCKSPVTEAYFADALKFLSTFSWIYDVQLTHILTTSTLKQFPIEWSLYLKDLSFEELNDLPSNPNLPAMPSSLSDFISMCCRLSVTRSKPEGVQIEQLPNDVIKGMNPKKRHEVARMSALVTQVSLSSNCPLVVDIGAGLGYLSVVLARNSALHVLALECKEVLTHGTETRAIDQGLSENIDTLTYNLQDSDNNFQVLREILRKKLGDCTVQEHVKSENRLLSQTPNLPTHLQVDNLTTNRTDRRPINLEEEGLYLNSPTNSQTHIPKSALPDESEAQAAMGGCDVPGVPAGGATVPEVSGPLAGPVASPAPGICLVGLHCCGSLTPTLMKMFVSTPELRSLVCVSCCYHSLHQQPDNTWTHFPMSQMVRTILESKLPGFTVSVFGMRLAAQETRSRWRSQTMEDHKMHRHNVGFRGLLQLVCQQEGLSIGKMKRHIAKRKDMACLDTYVAAVLARTGLSQQCPDVGRLLRDLHAEHTETMELIQPFTALQVALQSVLESLVLLDRIQFLREAGIDARLFPVFNDLISPRNLAIIAEKRR